jgi:hypothetical protein
MSEEKHVKLRNELLFGISDHIMNYIKTHEDDANSLPSAILDALVRLSSSYAETLGYSKDQVITAIHSTWDV